MSDFREFTNVIRKTALNMKCNLRKYPSFRGEPIFGSRQTAELLNLRIEDEIGNENMPDCSTRLSFLTSSDRCCITQKFGSVWVRCLRPCSSHVLAESLQKIALLKDLPLAIVDEDHHMRICLFHWRFIKYGRLDRISLPEHILWETPESRIHMENENSVEPDLENNPHLDGIDDSEQDVEISSDDWETEDVESEKEVYDWRDLSVEKSCQEDEEEDENDGESEEEDKNGLSTLSAASLRRYRKYFQIPTKASASKHSMLEGVERHFETLPVESRDAIAYFIYTAKNKLNPLD